MEEYYLGIVQNTEWSSHRKGTIVFEIIIIIFKNIWQV